MLGWILLNTPSRVAFGSTGKDVEYAIDFDQAGGIVTFAWQWNAQNPIYITTRIIHGGRVLYYSNQYKSEEDYGW